MPYAAIKRATGGLNELAQAIAVPHEHRPQRTPSFPNLERTAVVPTVATGTLGVASAIQRDFTLIRSPTFPLWTACTPSVDTASLFYTATPAGLNGFCSLNAVGSACTFPPDPFTGYGSTGVDTPWTTAMLRRYPLSRTKDGRVFVPCPTVGYASVRFSFSGSFTGQLFTTFELWDGTGEITHYTVNVVAAGVNADFVDNVTLKGGFYRLHSIMVNNFSAGNVYLSTFSLGVTSGTNLFAPTGLGLSVYAPLFAPPEFTSSRVPYGSTRANAAAVLLSNVTAVLDKEGTINCARVPRVTANKAFAGVAASTSAFIALISSVYPKDRYFGPMEKGLYSYTLPDSSTDDFLDCVSDVIGPDGAMMPVFQLESFEYVSLITFSDIGGSGSTLAVTQDVHLEFRSSSMLFPVGYSSTSLESYHMAQMALAQQGVFFENPIHLAAIGSLIRAAVTRIAPVVAPYARQAAIAVGNKLLGSAVSTLNTKMAQMGLSSSSQPKSRTKLVVQKKKARPTPRRK